ncbi:MAG: DUF2924 domain-containing protein [Pseudomonadota bacterium]
MTPSPPRAKAGDNPRRDVIAQWERMFGAPPPPYLAVSFMHKALMYEAQCKAKCGLTGQTKRALRRIASGETVRQATATRLSVGSVLVRAWNGRKYQVEVTGTGYLFEDKRWTSLSAIAKHITGATWSGRRFFGLRKTTK